MSDVAAVRAWLTELKDEHKPKTVYDAPLAVGQYDECAGCLMDWPCAVPALVGALEAVLDMHTPLVLPDPDGIVCDYCTVQWPCPDALAVVSAYTGQENSE